MLNEFSEYQIPEYVPQPIGSYDSILGAIEDELRILTDAATKERVQKVVDTFRLRAPDAVVVREGIDAGISELALPYIATKLEKHISTFKNVGRALFMTDRGMEWHSITGGEGKELIAENLAELDPEHIAARPWSEEHIDIEPAQAAAEESLVERVAEAIRLVRQNVPQAQRSRFGFIMRIIESKTDPAGNAEVNRQFIREQRAETLEDALARLTYALEHAEEIIVSETLQRLPTKGKATVLKYESVVDEYMAWSNSEVWTPAHTSTRAQRMADWLTQKEASRVDTEVSPTQTQNDTLVDEPEQQPDDALLEAIVPIGARIKAGELPWVDDASGVRVELLEGQDRPVYIVHAVAKKVTEIARISRESFAKNAQGMNKFDSALLQQARRMAKGIMPYQDANSVKRLKVQQADLRPEYRGNSYWYTFDITPNAPRVYFTVKKASEIIIGTTADDALALVVVGESDKQRQLDIFARFTTLSRTYLRNNGVGSI